MLIRRLQLGDEVALEQFLSLYPDTSMFLRSNLRASGLEYRDECYHGDYFASFRSEPSKDTINGVLAHYWNGNVMMQAEDFDSLKQLCFHFRRKISRPLAGILGDGDQSAFVISELGLPHNNFAINGNDGLYSLALSSLEILSLPQDKNVQMIQAGDIESSVLVEWIKQYEKAVLGLDNDNAFDARAKNRADRMRQEKNAWILLSDQTPVSLCGFNAQLPEIVQIGPVWTPPEHRNKGYARVLLALVLEQARTQGVKKAVLFTDNPAAAKAYQAVGFELLGSYRIALLKRPLQLLPK